MTNLTLPKTTLTPSGTPPRDPLQELLIATPSSSTRSPGALPLPTDSAPHFFLPGPSVGALGVSVVAMAGFVWCVLLGLGRGCENCRHVTFEHNTVMYTIYTCMKGLVYLFRVFRYVFYLRCTICVLWSHSICYLDSTAKY